MRPPAVVLVTENVTLAAGSSVVFDDAVLSDSALPAESMSVSVTVVCVELPLTIEADAGDRAMAGGSFTALTVTVKGSVAVNAPSLTVRVIVAEPA